MTASLSGATVLVTGAATGVGRALALEAARRGADLIAVDVTDPAETADMIHAAGATARSCVADVRDAEAVRALADELFDDGTVDVVCANAGTGIGGTVDTLASSDFSNVLAVNVLGVFHTVQAFLPALRRTRAAGRPASVLITGSEHSLGVPPYVPPMTAYTTSKHAVLGLAASLRRDLAEDDIQVSLLCPSYVRTERLADYASKDPAFASILQTYGQDADVVAAAAFDGLAAGQFVVPTNAVSRDFVVDLHKTLIDAMEAVTATGRPAS
ncbi:SDR family NAD(P)-dependent oxidoreductase [Actinomadura sp. LD22]|uniref:SDR family NAD(P)-dependent oxidoreductase n=1 Tax=Actinomadura physcomitrii TaxID=2650748 RepID=A0A6I4M350_9ACTN|nr:SDR family oxidoreductase [Actinomadura physcomitrii]MVZ99881.1 SDR family NAD(P)-dependent oxidoreductase [Actinomadura physcomitrii]